jgi:hypothetical protein
MHVSCGRRTPVYSKAMRRRIFLPALLALMAVSAFGIEIPRKSPEFVIDMGAGKQLLVSQYRGKVLCLVFILTT